MKKLSLTITALCLMAGAVCFAQSEGGAQPGGPQGMQMGPGGMPEAPQQLSAEERTTKIVDEMSTALDLTEKQYKKLYKLNLKEQQEQEENGPQAGGPMGGPGGPGGMRGGMGGPGGQMGQGGPMGGPGGQMGGPRGGMGGPGGQMGQGGPMGGPGGQMGSSEQDESDMEAYWTKKEKKYRKILSDNQFDTWYSLHPEMFGVKPEINIDENKDGVHGMPPAGTIQPR